MHKRELPGRSGDRLQAAVLRKRGRMLGTIAKIMGRRASTVHRWLYRMWRGGPEARYDGKSPGRPPKPDPEQERAVEEDLDRPPA